MIRKAQGEDEKRFAPEVKADNEKHSLYMRNACSTPPKTEQRQFIDGHWG